MRYKLYKKALRHYKHYLSALVIFLFYGNSWAVFEKGARTSSSIESTEQNSAPHAKVTAHLDAPKIKRYDSLGDLTQYEEEISNKERENVMPVPMAFENKEELDHFHHYLRHSQREIAHSALSEHHKSSKDRATPAKRVHLIISGGGMSNYGSALLLEKLEERLQGLSLTDGVDTFGGTSFGGIVATMLATNYSGHNIAQFFQTDFRNFFKKSFFRKLLSINGRRYGKYDDTFANTFLEEHFGHLSLATTVKPVMLPSLLVEEKEQESIVRNFMMNSYDASHSAAHDLPLNIALRAGISTPGCFDPLQILYEEKEMKALDASVVKNTPVFETLHLAQKTYGDISPEDHVIIIGSGYTYSAPKETNHWSHSPLYPYAQATQQERKELPRVLFDLEKDFGLPRQNVHTLDFHMDTSVYDTNKETDLDVIKQRVEDAFNNKPFSLEFEKVIQVLQDKKRTQVE